MMRVCSAVAAQVGLHLERARAEERLRHQAMHDALTSLPNRTLLRERLGRAMGAAEEHGRTLSLLLIDLDGFKGVNDTYGHHAGDDLLRQIAARLDQILRRSDTVARLGGDEFAVLLPSAATDEAVIVAQALLAQIVSPVVVEGVTVHVGASIGIAVFPEHARTPSLLMQCADAAMYDAKRMAAGIAVHVATSGRPSRGVAPGVVLKDESMESLGQG